MTFGWKAHVIAFAAGVCTVLLARWWRRRRRDRRYVGLQVEVNGQRRVIVDYDGDTATTDRPFERPADARDTYRVVIPTEMHPDRRWPK